MKFELAEGGVPTCSLKAMGKAIIETSSMGFELREGVGNSGLTLVSQKTSSHDESWKPVYGKRGVIRDHYNQLVVELVNSDGLKMLITFRAWSISRACG